MVVKEGELRKNPPKKPTIVLFAICLACVLEASNIFYSLLCFLLFINISQPSIPHLYITSLSSLYIVLSLTMLPLKLYCSPTPHTFNAHPRVSMFFVRIPRKCSLVAFWHYHEFHRLLSKTSLQFQLRMFASCFAN